MVGGRIDYPADHPDTVTPIPDCRIISPRYYARFVAACSVLMNGPHCPQEVLYVNEALCLTSRAALAAVGGFCSTAFPHLFAFHDLCCRLRQQGRKNFYTPTAGQPAQPMTAKGKPRGWKPFCRKSKIGSGKSGPISFRRETPSIIPASSPTVAGRWKSLKHG